VLEDADKNASIVTVPSIDADPPMGTVRHVVLHINSLLSPPDTEILADITARQRQPPTNERFALPLKKLGATVEPFTPVGGGFEKSEWSDPTQVAVTVFGTKQPPHSLPQQHSASFILGPPSSKRIR
jgi:hypothetical protein